MSETETAQPTTQQKLQDRLRPVLELIERYKVVASLVRRQPSERPELAESLLEREQRGQLARKLGALQPAEISHLLESLTPEDRLLAWEQVSPEIGGDVLWDLSDSVAEMLVERTDPERLLAMCRHMDTHDLAQIVELLPPTVLEALVPSLEAPARTWLESTGAYRDDQVGHLMGNDFVTVQAGLTLRQALRSVRRRGALPEQTDQFFVVDERGRLLGALPVTAVFVHRLREPVIAVMNAEVVTFTAEDGASAAAQAFERYDLVSAPVVDGKGKLVGRLTVDVVMDFVREEAEDDLLGREGLSGETDLFAPVLRSVRERWLWLALNLFTAFLASRVIGAFEGTIQQLVALATLMPIVASIGGNTGNQTIALVVRGLALDQIGEGNVVYLTLKEIGVAATNGVLWGGVMGLVAFLLYRDPTLGVVMGASTLLNLIVAAIAGVVVPLVMHRLGRDPAVGSSVLLTFTTDSMGFLIFLGLATLVLTR